MTQSYIAWDTIIDFMKDAFVAAGSTITKDVELEGAANFPIYVGKGKTI